jgi:hypothetical protein
MYLRRASVVVLAFVVLAGWTTHATILVPADFSELVRGADTIACGRVVDIYAVRVEGRYSDTLVTLAPSAVLKGERRGDIVFRVAGGETGRYRTVIVGAPVLHAGDEIVVFLAGQAPQVPHLVGFSQGLLPILRDEALRPVVLAPPLAEGDGAQTVVRGEGRTRLMTLAAFADQVRTLAEGQARERRAPGSAPRKSGRSSKDRP